MNGGVRLATSPIVVAGSTGELGRRIVAALVERGAAVCALVRSEKLSVSSDTLQGADIRQVDYSDAQSLERACAGAACVVSALSGLRDVIGEAQSQLLDAAVAAGVPRFIPSDFSIDYTALPAGDNRNLDLRREFRQRLDAAPIAATSILNGMFTELLVEQAPFVLFRLRRVLYFENPDQPLDFTMRDDTARFTARAAMEIG